MTDLAHIPAATLRAELARRVPPVATPAECGCPTVHECHSHGAMVARDVPLAPNAIDWPAHEVER